MISCDIFQPFALKSVPKLYNRIQEPYVYKYKFEIKWIEVLIFQEILLKSSS